MFALLLFDLREPYRAGFAAGSAYPGYIHGGAYVSDCGLAEIEYFYFLAFADLPVGWLIGLLVTSCGMRIRPFCARVVSFDELLYCLTIHLIGHSKGALGGRAVSSVTGIPALFI